MVISPTASERELWKSLDTLFVSWPERLTAACNFEILSTSPGNRPASLVRTTVPWARTVLITIERNDSSLHLAAWLDETEGICSGKVVVIMHSIPTEGLGYVVQHLFSRLAMMFNPFLLQLAFIQHGQWEFIFWRCNDLSGPLSSCQSAYVGKPLDALAKDNVFKSNALRLAFYDF